MGHNALTEATVNDATIGITLIEELDGAIASVTGDAAYDTIAFCDAAETRGTRVVVPPTKTAGISTSTAVKHARSHNSEGAGDRTTTMEEGIGLPSTGPRGERFLPVQIDHRRCGSSAESKRTNSRGAPRRYKSIIGNSLRARTPDGQAAGALLACNVLNQMAELGRPESYSVGR